MKYVLIAAMDKHRAIGKDGGIPWHIPKDFAWFKSHTLGQSVLMGRKCYSDIIKYTKGKPLPQRTNLVLTSQDLQQEGFHFFPNIEDATSFSQQQGVETLYIIGGAQLYNDFANHPDTEKIILTKIDISIDGSDTFFPKFNENLFNKTYEAHDSENGFNFTFEIYEKKR